MATLQCSTPHLDSLDISLEEELEVAEDEEVAVEGKTAGGDASKGILRPIAARVLMNLLYAVRMCRPDMLRAVCHLACFITKWDALCDKKLHRLMCYVHPTYHYRMVGWVGDASADISPTIEGLLARNNYSSMGPQTAL